MQDRPGVRRWGVESVDGVAVEHVDIASLRIAKISGPSGTAWHEPPNVGGDACRRFRLLACRNARWQVVHRNALALAPGDAVLVDSSLPCDLQLHGPFEMIDIGMPDGWIRQWLARPGALAGRPLSAGGDGWSRALTSYVALLSPSFLAQTPLPLRMMVDHIGVLLALAQVDEEPSAPQSAHAVVDLPLHERIGRCIDMKCMEPSLSAATVASALDISTRTLHRHLAAAGMTFGVALTTARVRAASRMLKSSQFSRLTISEIGRRAGFPDSSHFARAFSRVHGCTPSAARGGASSGVHSPTQAGRRWSSELHQCAGQV